jgi:acetyl esterase/lipase
MHRALRAQRVDAELHIYDGQSHGDYIPDLTHDFPEADDAIEEISRFFNRHLK